MATAGQSLRAWGIGGLVSCIAVLFLAASSILLAALAPGLSPDASQAVLALVGGGLCGATALTLGRRHARRQRRLEARREERLRLEGALVDAEERYQQFFEQSGDAMALVDAASGEIVHCNAAACASLGYRRDELDGSRLDRIDAEPESGRLRSQAALARKQGGLSLGLRARMRTGEIRDLQMRLQPLAARGRDYLLASWQDVTEQNVMRERILEQCQLLETLIQTIPCPLFYKDAAGRYTGCNRAFADFLGRPREEIIGKSVYDLAPQEIAEEYFRRDRELFTNPGRQVYEWKVKTPRGIREVIFHKATFSDAEGRVAGLIGVILDITDIGQARREMAAHHERLLRQHQALSELTIPDLLGGGTPNESLQRLAAAAAATLGIARVGIWRTTPLADAIHCLEQYAADRAAAMPTEIRAADCPAYFAAMLGGRVVDAADAFTDPRTRELADGYLRPHGIGAMLDVPLHVGGKMVGVVCHEHLGGAREWTPEDRSFALSVANLASLVLEVHERLGVEEKLAKALKTHQALLETAPAAVFTVDARRNISSWNRKAEEITGYPPEEMVGHPCTIFAKDPCRERCGLFDEAVAKPILDRRCVIRRRDGREIPIIKSATLVHGREGEVIGGIEVFREDRPAAG